MKVKIQYLDMADINFLCVATSYLHCYFGKKEVKYDN